MHQNLLRWCPQDQTNRSTWRAVPRHQQSFHYQCCWVWLQCSMPIVPKSQRKAPWHQLVYIVFLIIIFCFSAPCCFSYTYLSHHGHHGLELDYPKEASWKWPDNNHRPPWVLLQQCFSSLRPGRTCRCRLSSAHHHPYMNGVCVGGSWSISANVTRAINATALFVCIVMATTGDHWSLLFQLWRSSLIISSCTTKTIIGRLLYQLHVQRHALIASFISFMLKGDHCSLLLSAMCLMAITDCLCYQLYDWRRSMVAFFINYVIEGDQWSLLLSTTCMKERHWSLPVSVLCLKAIADHFFWIPEPRSLVYFVPDTIDTKCCSS